MTKLVEQSFTLDRWFIRLSHLGIWFFVALALLSIGLAVFETIESPEKKGALVVYVLIALVFAGFAYAGYRVAKQLGSAPVSVDEDGVWSTHRGKSDGLVRWEEVTSIKERQYGQRLELFGKDGALLIKLEYQLHGFEQLRQIVLSKVRQSTFDVRDPATFKKSAGYHVFTICFIAGFTGLAYYVGQTHPILGVLTFALVVVLSARDYLKTVAELKISRRTLEIKYPLRRKTLDVSEVNAIYLSDQFVKGSRLPEVIVASHTGEKPIRLKQLGIDASALYDLLTKWKNEKLFI